MGEQIKRKSDFRGGNVRLSSIEANLVLQAGSLLAPSGDYHGAAILDYGMSPTGKVRVVACITWCKMNINNKQSW